MDLSDVKVKRVVDEARQLAADLGVDVHEFLEDATRHYVAELRHFAALGMRRRGEDVEVPNRCPLEFNLNPHSQWSPVEAWVRRGGPARKKADPPVAGTTREDLLLQGLVKGTREDLLLQGLVKGTLSRRDALELHTILEAELAAASDDMKPALAVLVAKAEAISVA